jgi:hypothetical protein
VGTIIKADADGIGFPESILLVRYMIFNTGLLDSLWRLFTLREQKVTEDS